MLDLLDPNDLSGVSDWETDFRQIEPGPMHTRIVVRQGPELALLKIQMDRAVHQSGCSPVGMVTLGIPQMDGVRSWFGKRRYKHGLLDFGERTEFESVSRPDFSGLTVSINQQYSCAFADKVGLPLPGETSQTETVSRAAAQSLFQLQSYADALLSRGSRFSETEQEELLIGLFSSAADGELHNDRSSLSARTKAVRMAIDFVQQSEADSILISDVCASINVPLRTLRRAFQESFGIGPRTYFNRVRLGRVRKELLKEKGKVSIADAANKLGFWHMGQFARDYRTMFGELPSETLGRGSTE